MELLIVILNKEEYFEKIASLLVEAGISEATILDSQGVGSFLACEVPIFAGLKQFMGEGKGTSKIIMAVVEKKSDFDDFKKLLNEEGIDFTMPGIGVIAMLPLNEVIKFKKP